MNSIEIVKKHLSPEVPLELINEDGSKDILMLKPLDFGQRILCSQAYELINKEVKDEVETSKILFDLGLSIIKKAIPEADEETAENFTLTHLDEIIRVLPSLLPKAKGADKINLIKEMQEQHKEAKVDG